MSRLGWWAGLGVVVVGVALGCASGPVQSVRSETAWTAESPAVGPIRWEALASWRLGGRVEEPRGVAVDGGGRVFVADYAAGRVLVWNERGEFVQMFGGYGPAPGELAGPVDLAASRTGPLGHLYIAERENRRVQGLVPRQNRFWVVLEEESGIVPRAIAVGRSERLFLLDERTRRVWRIEPGRPPEPFGTEVFQDPLDLAVGRSDAVLVLDRAGPRLVRMDFTGAVVAAVGPEAGLQEPVAVACDDSGRWYVLDVGAGQLRLLTPEGRRLGSVPIRVGAVGGLTVSNGVVLILDAQRRQLLRYRVHWGAERARLGGGKKQR